MVEQLKEGLYKIFIPFDNIYTSSFILTNGNDCIIFDSGSSDEDAKNYIIPEIEKLGVTPKYLVTSHTHGDHMGGINAIKKEYPDIVSALFSSKIEDSYVLTDGEILLDRFQMLNLKGHSDDCLGILDLKTSSLFSGDSLQLYGVDKYKTYVCDKEGYENTLKRVLNLNLDTIYASHEYEPYGSCANKENIIKYIEACKL